MSRERRGHEGKSDADRRQYVSANIREQRPTRVKEGGPTAEDRSPIIDPTDYVAAAGIAATGHLTPTIPRREEGGDLRNWLVRGIGAVLVSLMGWGAYQLYGMNREVGEMKSDVKSIRERGEEVKSEVGKVETRLGARIESIAGEVRRLEERILDGVGGGGRRGSPGGTVAPR
jgi:hypothetical protein